MIDEDQIRSDVFQRLSGIKVHVDVDQLTPAGRLRTAPIYEGTVSNDFLGASRVLKGRSLGEVEHKAREQLTKWAEQEIKRRIGRAQDDAKSRAAEATDEAERRISELGGLLAATLAIDDRINWDEMADVSVYPEFVEPLPFTFVSEPPRPRRTLWQWLLAWRWTRALRHWTSRVDQWKHTRDLAQKAFEADRLRQLTDYVSLRDSFLLRQSEHNCRVKRFQASFEAGDPASIEEYVRTVFERSAYPDCFFREYDVGFDVSSKTVVVDIALPAPESIPNVVAVKYDSKSKQQKTVLMKQQDHEALYDDSVKQCILRTVHEVFESADTPHVESVVVNGWVTKLDPSSGHDTTSCIISLATSREGFRKLNLERVDPDKCIKALKGLTAGPLADVAPVRPLLHLDRKDHRFIEARQVLADMNSTTNLAAIAWEGFEHLVRELFSKLFTADGAEVKVTRSSRDAGVDAVAFDPDPIRGGKFVIQAKRYTSVVPVSAVRDL